MENLWTRGECRYPYTIYSVYRCFGGFGSGVCSVLWDPAFEGGVVAGCFVGRGGVSDGVGGWVSRGSPPVGELPCVARCRSRGFA